MSEGKALGLMIDNESKDRKTRFDIAKFDSDPWVKKNMAWDSDGNLDGSATIGAILDNAKDKKFLTIQVRTTEGSSSFYKILQKAINKEKHDTKGVFDAFQLFVDFDGIRRSVTFPNPIVKLVKSTPDKNKVNFMTFSITTKGEVDRDKAELV